MSTEALNNVVLVNLDVDVPTGRKVNHASDLKLSEIPPEGLMSLGQKTTFDPSLVKPLNTMRKAAERRLTKFGVKFLGGFAIPVSDKDAALADIAEIKRSFEDAAAEFFRAYPQSVQDWTAQAGEWQHALVNAADSVEVIQKKTRFDFRVFTVNAVDQSDDGDWAANGMAGQLFHEVAGEAAKTFKESLHSKDKVTHKVRSPFQRMKQKLAGLAFLDKGIQALVDRIDDTMRALPPQGTPIEGPALSMLQGLCMLLKDEDNVHAFVEAARSQDSETMDGLFSIAPSVSGALDLHQPAAQPEVSEIDDSSVEDATSEAQDDEAADLPAAPPPAIGQKAQIRGSWFL